MLSTRFLEGVIAKLNCKFIDYAVVFYYCKCNTCAILCNNAELVFCIAIRLGRIDGKDQYGQDKAIENLQVERLTSPNNVDAAHWTIDGNKLTFKGCDQTPGTYTYRALTVMPEPVTAKFTV
mgnify:CR=1 FL=1